MSDTILSLTKKAYDYYIDNVKNNKNTSYEVARKKLTRNVQMAEKLDQTFYQKLLGSQIYRYGNLYLTVKRGAIVKILNIKGKTIPGWKKDNNLYEELNKSFSIHN